VGTSRGLCIAILLLTAASCASRPPPPSPPPPPKPAPVVAPKPAPAPVQPKPVPVKPKPVFRPSMAAADNVNLDGAVFILRSTSTLNERMVRQYYMAGEGANGWTRRVDLQAFPAQAGMGPAELANQLGKQLQAANPYAKFNVHEDRKTGTATLDYLVSDAAALKGDYVELDVCRFAMDTLTKDVVGIHYIEHIHIDPKGSTQDSRTKVQTTRARILLEIVKAPLYRE
jgi:hypothetical protein